MATQSTMETLPFINIMVNKFYEYMGDIYIEYNQLEEKPMVNTQEVNNQEVNNQEDNNQEDNKIEIQIEKS